MSINTNKKIKKISYNQTNIPVETDLSNVSVTSADVLADKTFVDSSGNFHKGKMRVYNGTTTLTGRSQTIYTANTYLTSNISSSVSISNPASYLRRHLNPTIIRIDLRNVTLPYTMTIKLRNVSSKNPKEFKINWGDGSDSETISTSTSTQTKTHSYTAYGVWTIVFTPTSQDYNRFYLGETPESSDMLTFDQFMFGQSANSPFAIPISIYFGDCIGFRAEALSYCTAIETLDFANMNSLLEDYSVRERYYTQKSLVDGLCRNSIIWTLIIGSGIGSFGSNCFNGTAIWNMVVIDARGTGLSTTPINVPNNNTLPTINGKILINHLRLDRYKQASYWSAKSSQMIGY